MKYQYIRILLNTKCDLLNIVLNISSVNIVKHHYDLIIIIILLNTKCDLLNVVEHQYDLIIYC